MPRSLLERLTPESVASFEDAARERFVDHRKLSRERAEAVYRRLSEAVPGPYWSRVHEVSNVA